VLTFKMASPAIILMRLLYARHEVGRSFAFDGSFVGQSEEIRATFLPIPVSASGDQLRAGKRKTFCKNAVSYSFKGFVPKKGLEPRFRREFSAASLNLLQDEVFTARVSTLAEILHWR
jgi:hypothetical protein